MCGDTEHGRDGLALCPTGSCEEDCSQYDDVYDNPCWCDLFPIACPIVVDYYDDCFATFQPFYDNATNCQEEGGQGEGDDEWAEWSPPTIPTKYCIMFYAWFSSVTLLIVCWCYYNEKLFPNYMTTSMCLDDGQETTLGDKLHQHGYKHCIVGTTIYALVIITIAGIQIVLFLIVIAFHKPEVLPWSSSGVFLSDITLLWKSFVSVWLAGFPFTALMYSVPSGFRHLFLRRCPLPVATHVLVVAPEKSRRRNRDSGNRLFASCVGLLSCPFSAIVQTLLSYPYNVPGKEIVFCRVTADRNSGRRWITFRHRRYVLDLSKGGFSPGRVEVGKLFQDFFSQSQGLTTPEAMQRMSIVGPNKTILTKPTLAASIVVEFSRLFYVYQNFIVWVWFLYPQDFIIGIVYTLLRVAGGAISSYFRWTGATSLYKLSREDGSIA
jgi:hypothetical protein